MAVAIVTTAHRVETARRLFLDRPEISRQLALLDLQISGIYTAEDFFLTGDVSRLELDNPSASSAAYAGDEVMTSHILLREQFFRYDDAIKEFILAHELRHAWQRMVSPKWRQCSQERLRIATFASWNRESRCQIFDMLSGPTEVDAECWTAQCYPAYYRTEVKQRINDQRTSVRDYVDAQASAFAALADLLPLLYKYSHARYRKCMDSKLPKLLNTAMAEFLHFIEEKCHPAITRGELIRLMQAEEPAEFLRRAEVFIIGLRDRS